MDIKDCHIEQKVMTETGRIGYITGIFNRGAVYVMFGSGDCAKRMKASDLSPVSDPCTTCEMASTITSQCKQIAELQRSLDAWKADAERYARNAHYWRDELYRLQNEALAECKPMYEVAKIYIQVSPGVLDRILKARD